MASQSQRRGCYGIRLLTTTRSRTTDFLLKQAAHQTKQHHTRLHITINITKIMIMIITMWLTFIRLTSLDFDLSGFSKLTKEQVLQLRGPHLRTKAPYTVATPNKIMFFAILTILKSVLNFNYNFVIFLFFFL